MVWGHDLLADLLTESTDGVEYTWHTSMGGGGHESGPG